MLVWLLPNPSIVAKAKMFVVFVVMFANDDGEVA